MNSMPEVAARERELPCPREAQGEFADEVGRRLEEAAVTRAREAWNRSRSRARSFAGAEVVSSGSFFFDLFAISVPPGLRSVP